uniref:Uncharacterized protein n=1 Tax=Anguilla anguilla TaxID=7936 RepID=A0A0E9R0Y6_ANGAN
MVDAVSLHYWGTVSNFHTSMINWCSLLVQKRPSCLSIFSRDGIKTRGLFALQGLGFLRRLVGDPAIPSQSKGRLGKSIEKGFKVSSPSL